MPALDMNFEASAASTQPMDMRHAPEPARLDAPDLTLSENSLNFSTEPSKPPLSAAPAAAEIDSGMIEFDMASLSLDLPGEPAAATVARVAAPATADSATAPLVNLDGGSTGGFEPESPSDDPLATKLALAQEFNAIGDPDGARSLAEEVLAEASGELKSRAQRFLAEIN